MSNAMIPRDGLLTSRLADAQVCRLAAGGANTAGLESDFVEPAVFRTGFTEPPRRERGLDSTGEEEVM